MLDKDLFPRFKLKSYNLATIFLHHDVGSKNFDPLSSRSRGTLIHNFIRRLNSIPLQKGFHHVFPPFANSNKGFTQLFSTFSPRVSHVFFLVSPSLHGSARDCKTRLRVLGSTFFWATRWGNREIRVTGRRCCRKNGGVTLPPIIHGFRGKWGVVGRCGKLVSKWAIFHFHDHERKGSFFFLGQT